MLGALCCPLADAAGEEGITAEIAVEIRRGGTAKIIPKVNCPVPEETTVVVNDGELGRFHIHFTAAGEYHYTVISLPDERHLKFDDRVYEVDILVKKSKTGLVTTIIVYESEEKYSYHTTQEVEIPVVGPERLYFENKAAEDPTKPTNPDNPNNPDNPDNPTGPDNSDNPDNAQTLADKSGKKPYTGDDSMLETYLLIAFMAAAGLFTLSLVYYRSVVPKKKTK